MRKSSSDREAGRSEERRKAVRHTMILRVGLIEQAGRSSFCLVKNISPVGIQIKFYSRPVLDAEASIQVADEPAAHGQVVWVKNDVAGISFKEQLDPATLLRIRQKLTPNRRRSIPRINIEARATLYTGGRTCRAGILDISTLGARIRTRSSVTPGDTAVVRFADLPPIKAYIRWSDGEESGLVFETPIPMQIIVDWIEERIHEPSHEMKQPAQCGSGISHS